MKIILIGIDAKYIHTNNAVRLLKANSTFEMDILEYTIKDDIHTIIDDIISNQPDVIGFSCYIWNISLIKNILEALPLLSSTIILGGPEVSYDPEFYLQLPQVQFIIRGEGELVFEQLLQHIKHGTSYQNQPGIAFYHNQQLFINPIEEIEDITSLVPPYYFPSDQPHITHKIGYIESSRGCPYNCSYCLSSLEKKVRFFTVREVQKAIQYLMDNGSKTIKFLDRTFNANAHTLDIIDYIIEHDNHTTVFQFEITGDVLPEKIVNHINKYARKGLFRFEIGIQSINEETNLLVDRFQNTERLFERIRQIQAADIIDLHLDLIAGLPKENKDSFINTFNQVYKLGAKELQLGFLKMLRGTKIRFQADLYKYKYNKEAPYEIIENESINHEEIIEIKAVEHMLEMYHNKGYFGFHLSNYIQNLDSPYHFFLALAKHYERNQYSIHRYQIVDVYQHLIEICDETLLYGLYQDYLLRSKIKPHIFFDLNTTKQERQVLFKILSESEHISLHLLYKHSVVLKYNQEYFCAYYTDNKCIYYKRKAPY